MKKLRILDAQDFRIHIEKSIEENNLFFHEYEIATDNLNNIWKSQKALDKSKDMIVSENPNNIIAFCGERGSGKSSVMLSFMNAIEKSKNENTKLDFDEEIKKNNWSTRIVIDPSMFDGVHNIVDIVLAHIYQDFREFYEKDNQKIEKHQREEMLDRLAKTYKSLSIIKNKEKVLDNEYDVAGNISNLQKLGESTRLRDNLKELIDLYLYLISKDKSKDEEKSKKLLIAIDDLDLCNEYAYDMAEQIRKYLILPNVIILMAIKIDQLEMGVEEKNRENFKNIISARNNDSILEREMRVMAERYVTKLIPTARRIYLPKLESKQVQVEMNTDLDNNEVVGIIENVVIGLIREKTGMIFIPSEHSYNYFVPVNLRELVNLITFLKGMQHPDNNEQKLENIYEFRSYFVEEILKKEIDRAWLYEVLKIFEDDDNSINHNLSIYLESLLIESKARVNIYTYFRYEFPIESIAAVVEWLNIVSTNLTKRDERRLVYYLKIYYTILLNVKLQGEKNIFTSSLCGFLWGNALNGIIPAALNDNNQPYLNRERFFIPTISCWNAIANALNEWDNSLFIQKKDDTKFYVSGIKEENEIAEIICWMMLAMLSCPTGYSVNGKFFMNKDTFVYNNYMVSSIGIVVSVENYFVNLCYLEDLYRITNLELLGISSEEISIIISAMNKENAELIEQSKSIFVNADLSMRLLAYCNEHRENSDAKLDDRTYLLFKNFFKNVDNFMEENGMGKVEWSKLWIPKCINEQGEVKGDYIDICRVYTQIFEAEEKIIREQYVNTNYGNYNMTEGQIIKQNFSRQVENIALIDYFGKINRIPGSLRNKKSGYVKAVLENIANTIQKYTYKEKKYPDSFDVRQLIKLYSDVVDLYMVNSEINISDRQYEEYKAIARMCSKIVME